MRICRENSTQCAHTTYLLRVIAHECYNLARGFALQGAVAEAQALAVDGCHEAVAHLEANNVELKLHLILCKRLHQRRQAYSNYVAVTDGGEEQRGEGRGGET